MGFLWVPVGLSGSIWVLMLFYGVSMGPSGVSMGRCRPDALLWGFYGSQWGLSGSIWVLVVFYGVSMGPSGVSMGHCGLLLEYSVQFLQNLSTVTALTHHRSLEEGCQKGLEIGKSLSFRSSKICLG